MRLMTGLATGLLLLGVAACGGSDGGNEIATAGGTPTASASASPGGGEGSLVAYAACMRENGIPMEDPETGSDGEAKIKLSIPKGMDKSTVDAAEKKCRPLMPNGGVMPKAQPEQMERMREMARCMRENGFPAFPDPTPEGGIQLTPESGIDFSDPAFKAAQEKCEPAGGVTDKESE